MTPNPEGIGPDTVTAMMSLSLDVVTKTIGHTGARRGPAPLA